MDSTYFPRPIVAEKAYQVMKGGYEERGWTVEVKEKEKRIIVPGEDINESIITD